MLRVRVAVLGVFVPIFWKMSGDFMKSQSIATRSRCLPYFQRTRQGHWTRRVLPPRGPKLFLLSGSVAPHKTPDSLEFACVRETSRRAATGTKLSTKVSQRFRRTPWRPRQPFSLSSPLERVSLGSPKLPPDPSTCSDPTLTNCLSMGTAISLSLDNHSGEQTTCSGSDANCSKPSGNLNEPSIRGPARNFETRSSEQDETRVCNDGYLRDTTP